MKFMKHSCDQVSWIYHIVKCLRWTDTVFILKNVSGIRSEPFLYDPEVNREPCISMILSKSRGSCNTRQTIIA